MRRGKYNKYDILEITWLDSHSGGGWTTPTEFDEWIKNADTDFVIKTLGYFVQEDDNFLRICQSHDNQGKKPDRKGDNLDGNFAITKNCIKNIRKFNNNKKYK